MMSICGCVTSACQSSVIQVVPALIAACARRCASPRRSVHACEVGARRVGRKVGNRHQVHARRAGDLREVHRAELAGADQADAHRVAFGRALLELL